jgi:hypothetical protein
VGSAFAHAVLMLVLPGEATEPTAAPSVEPPHRGPSLFSMALEDPQAQRCPGPPMPALAACFEREALSAHDYRLSPGVAYGALVEQPFSWRALAPTGGVADVDAALFHTSVAGCADVAKGAGWSGGGRVFVRVARGADGQARTQAWSLDDEARDPRLVCCLRESQALLAARVPPGQEVRYVMRFAAEGIELSPNPLPQPFEAYEVLPCGGEACDF